MGISQIISFVLLYGPINKSVFLGGVDRSSIVQHQIGL